MSHRSIDTVEVRPVCPACGHIDGAHLNHCRIAQLERERDELRAKLNLVLNMHNRNLEAATKAFREDIGHYCESRRTVEAIMQRSWDAIKIKA